MLRDRKTFNNFFKKSFQRARWGVGGRLEAYTIETLRVKKNAFLGSRFKNL